MRSRVRIRNVDAISRGLHSLTREIKSEANQIIHRRMLEAVAFAQDKAPWTDRTGNARRSIDTSDLSSGSELRHALLIGVDYGIWLELANQGKYRIIGPTMEVYAPQINRDLRSII